MTILIAEDNRSIATYLKHRFEDSGFSTILCQNGEDASHFLLSEEDKPALAFFDLHMPIMGGLEAVRKVRSKGVFIPIIAMTSSLIGETIGLGALPGFDGLITKPFAEQEIAQLLSPYSFENE